MKISLIHILMLVALVAGGLVYTLTDVRLGQSSDNCPYYQPAFGGDDHLLACHGLASVSYYKNSFGEKVYIAEDLKHKYVISELHSASSYKFIGDYIYI